MITYKELSIKNRMTNIKGLDMSLVSASQISFINDDAVSYEIEYYGNYVNTYNCILFLMM